MKQFILPFLIITCFQSNGQTFKIVTKDWRGLLTNEIGEQYKTKDSLTLQVTDGKIIYSSPLMHETYKIEKKEFFLSNEGETIYQYTVEGGKMWIMSESNSQKGIWILSLHTLQENNGIYVIKYTETMYASLLEPQ